MFKCFKSILCLFLLCCAVGLKAQITPPYINNFNTEADTIGWNSFANYGDNNWQISVFYGWGNWPLAFGWTTNKDDVTQDSTESFLVSPKFDLSDTSDSYILSFIHEPDNTPSTKNYFTLEYSIDDSTWHEFVEENYRTSNWLDSGKGFNLFGEVRSSVELKSLQGNAGVRFRFKAKNKRWWSDVWFIDSFEVVKEYENLSIKINDSFSSVGKYFTSINIYRSIVKYFNFFQIERTNRRVNFYYSSDTIFDVNDVFLDSTLLYMSYSNYIEKNVAFDNENIFAGDNYVLAVVDPENITEESNEIDNIGAIPIEVLETFETPIKLNFDSSTHFFNHSENDGWSIGVPNMFHAEKARSGKNSLHAFTTFNDNYKSLVSPYINFTNTSNNFFCFWYKHSAISTTSALINFSTLQPDSIVGRPLSFSNEAKYTIPANPSPGWDCFCADISEYDNQKTATFKLSVSNVDAIEIDDFYIGESMPNLAIEGEKELLYSLNSQLSDTLHYYYYNGGTEPVGKLSTAFYYSLDSIFDQTDLLLTIKQEDSLAGQTNVFTSITYSKPPNIPEEYFIVYKTDVGEEVIEMFEEDNVGFFKITNIEKREVPYFQDFESGADGWKHTASLGNDDWEIGIPSSPIYSKYITSNAFVTNLSGIVDSNARMHLLTPIFDLTTIENPVLEFDAYSFRFGRYTTANIMYSTNGGSTWIILDTTNVSYKNMYYPQEFKSISGTDGSLYPLGTHHFPYGYYPSTPTFTYFRSYQGRDYDDSYHFILDLSFLENEANIQFMFVYGNISNYSEGLVIDNFSISSAYDQFEFIDVKSIMAHNKDARIKQNCILKNNGNYISNPLQVNIHLSTDSTLQESDKLIATKYLKKLLPNKKRIFNLDIATPNNYKEYNYLLLEVVDTVTKGVKTVGVMPLDMDISKTYEYNNTPLLYDFNEEIIDGWKWYHDSTGYSSHQGHRFRHKLLFNETNLLYNIAQGSEWFLEPIDALGYNVPINQYPTYYIESPPFDFYKARVDEISFDIMCAATTFQYREGGNFQYSVDGGKTFKTFTKNDCLYTTNWYNVPEIESLDEEPGWAWLPEWKNVKIASPNLTGYENVIFRFKYRAKHRYELPGIQGFKLDNFKITAEQIYEIRYPDIFLCEGDSVEVFGAYVKKGGTYLNYINDTGYVAQKILEKPIYFSQDTQIICKNEVFIFPDSNQFQVTKDTIYDSFLETVFGCDSVIQTNIIVQEYNLQEDLMACKGNVYTFHDGTEMIIESDTSHRSILSSELGCDSIIVTNLTVESHEVQEKTITVCKNSWYIFPDKVEMLIENNMTYESQLYSKNGCDSIIVTNVLIEEVDVTLLCNDSSYFGAVDSSSYTWVDCDNDYKIISENDNYVLKGGAYNLGAIVEQNGCIDTTLCYTEENDDLLCFEQLTTHIIYPNPFIDEINIKFKQIYARIEITIFDLSGSIVFRTEFSERQSVSVQPNLASGAYILQYTLDGLPEVQRVFGIGWQE
jgi:hypothetical protein